MAPTLQVQGPYKGVGPRPGHSWPEVIIPVTQPRATCRPSSQITVPVSEDGFTSRRSLVPSTHGKKPAYNLSKLEPEPKKGEEDPCLGRKFKRAPKKKPHSSAIIHAEVFFNGFKGSFA